MKEFSTTELGYCAFEFYNSEDIRTLPDWDSSLYVEFRDSANVLQFTATTGSSPALEQDTDSIGYYIKLSGIPLTNYAIGTVTAYVYAKIDQIEVGDYPFQLTPFTVAVATTEVTSGYASNSLILSIRNFMRDKPELNRLIAGHETTDQTILVCMESAADEWNSTPPTGISTITITSSGTDVTGRELKIVGIPTNLKWLFLEKVMCKILLSVLLLRARNILSYTDNGVQVADEQGTYQAEIGLLQMMEQKTNTQFSRHLMAQNMNQLLGTDGGLGSAYTWYQDFWY